MLLIEFMVLCCAVLCCQANSMSGTFQSCKLQCDQDEGVHQQFAPSSSRKLLRGKSGPQGVRGEKGQQGSKGESGESCDVAEIEALKSVVSSLQKNEKRMEKDLLELTSKFEPGENGYSPNY